MIALGETSNHMLEPHATQNCVTGREAANLAQGADAVGPDAVVGSGRLPVARASLQRARALYAARLDFRRPLHASVSWV